jgi:uncharacterized membrane protein
MNYTFVKKNNVISTTQRLLKLLKVKVTDTTLKEKLQNHIDYPSLLAISEVFQDLNIDNYTISITVCELPEVPTPCLALIKKETLIIINSIENGIVNWWHFEYGNMNESVSIFADKWSGILMLVNSSELSGENEFKLRLRKELIFYIGNKLLIFFSLLFFLVNIYLFTPINEMSVYVLLLVVTKILGVFISVLLLWHIIDRDNSTFSNICRIGKNLDCDSVLDSKGAKIGGIISLSEIGFFYFTGSLLYLMFSKTNNSELSILMILNLLCILFSLFSVYYQAIVLKKWCTLCLSILFIFWIEFILLQFEQFKIQLNFRKDLLFVFPSFILPIISWYWIKPLLKSSKEIDNLNNSLRKFKNNVSVFRFFLMNSPIMPVIPSQMAVIEIGDPTSPNTMTIVTNPYCNACASVHSTIIELQKNHSEYIRCQIVFGVAQEDSNVINLFVTKLLSLDTSIRNEALEIWFKMKEKKIETWIEQIGVDKFIILDKNILDLHKKWCLDASIESTPTFFFNGHLLPESYHIYDFQKMASSILKNR